MVDIIEIGKVKHCININKSVEIRPLHEFVISLGLGQLWLGTKLYQPQSLLKAVNAC